MTEGLVKLRAAGPAEGRSHRSILGVRVDATSYADAVDRVVGWARGEGAKCVYVANVNNVMEAQADPAYLHLMNDADLVTPDGMPLVWGLRMLGLDGATRVRGPDLLPRLLEASSREGIPIGFYGGTETVLEHLLQRATGRWPELEIAYAKSPPFRALSPEEDAETVREIDESGVKLLFVGLGCPKQERWMSEHRASVSAVMVGVGAAFDFLAGSKRQAPRWLQRMGLEWLFRLATEPRRLWRRYVLRNPAFVVLFCGQVIHDRLLRQRRTLRTGRG